MQKAARMHPDGPAIDPTNHRSATWKGTAMSIIHENPPDPSTTASAADLTVTTYKAYAMDHAADASAWTDAEARAFAYLADQVRTQVRQTGPETWTQVDPATGEERRFTSGVAAVLWVADHLVTA